METRAGIELTKEETKLVNQLKRVAKNWKINGKRLWLFSGAGVLHVMMSGGPLNPNPNMGGSNPSLDGVNPDNIITNIGITNDGGDW